jgi:hypothetical protein
MVRIHRVVASEKIGRSLKPGEVVHHRNKNREDWSKRNLEVTTMPEHTAHHAAVDRPLTERSCAECGKKLEVPASEAALYESSFCNKTCHSKFQEKASWPNDSELSRLVWERPVIQIAETLGVSDAAVKKRCKRRNIATPPRGYWSGR